MQVLISITILSRKQENKDNVQAELIHSQIMRRGSLLWGRGGGLQLHFPMGPGRCPTPVSWAHRAPLRKHPWGGGMWIQYGQTTRFLRYRNPVPLCDAKYLIVRCWQVIQTSNRQCGSNHTPPWASYSLQVASFQALFPTGGSQKRMSTPERERKGYQEKILWPEEELASPIIFFLAVLYGIFS